MWNSRWNCRGLPWWHSGWESTCQCRGHGFEPWSGKIPHATEQLSPCTTTTEPTCCNYWSPCATTPEPACCNYWSLCALGPACHNYWARVLQLFKPAHLKHWSPCALGPTCNNYWARVLQLLKPARLEPVLRNKRSHHNEKPVHRNEEQHLLATTRKSPCAAMKTQRSQK